MFDVQTYVERRNRLKKKLGSGVVLLLGNEESPMNYPDNPFHFRQDSSFLYFFGLDQPGLAGIIDIDQDRETVFGYDFGVDDIVWMGPQPTLANRTEGAGVEFAEPLEGLEKRIGEVICRGRKVHYLPQYRGDNFGKIEKFTGIAYNYVNAYASVPLIKAVVEQRLIKSEAEVVEIEKALDISYEMYQLVLKLAKPGIYEKEIAGAMEGLVLARGSAISFPIILSIHGEVLHGHSHENLMNEGDIFICDSGAESPLHYASDITRTFPVGEKFTEVQKDVYNVVLQAHDEAITMMKPGISFKEVHLHAAKVIAAGMKNLGFMKGNSDDAIAAGAHALFFPHGLGHAMGLDVHDMEGLGEYYVGYNDKVKRSDQFGLAYLRFAKKLEPGHVMTIEPGIYFMPELVQQWKSQDKHTDFINYDKVEAALGFGGIRIEDDVLVTETGHKVLGEPIPKTVEEIESIKN
ncbi:MAG TPA: aminopeptidase P family protein [Bacteroidetes bacterium]|nr:aminopeptidase P family protein [Bacteroidota bacterium]